MTEPRFDTISFLSDYGTVDEFVGVVHSVIRSVAPSVRVIDVTHEIEPHDVRAGGLTLARAVQYLAPGIALAIVDPGVGTDRKSVAIEVADGAAYLVGPDNGLLAPAISLIGGATGAVVLDNTDYHLPAAGPTFAGRDIFAPAAAHLCLGVPLEELGSAIDPVQLMPGILPVSSNQPDGSIDAEVLWVDRFGNAQLNVDPEELEDWGDQVSVAGGRSPRTAQRTAAFADIPTGGVGLIVDSYGLLCLAVDRGSAALELTVSAGSSITLSRVEDGEGGASEVVSSPVTLSAKPADRPSTTRPPNPHEESSAQ